MSEENKAALSDEQKAKLPELSQVIELVQQIAAKQKQDSTDRETLDRLTAKVEELSTEMSKSSQERKAEWNAVDADRLIKDKNIPGGNTTMKMILENNSPDPEFQKAQEVLDRSYMLSAITKKPVQELKYFRQEVAASKLLQKAVGRSDLFGNAGADQTGFTGWQPAVFSQRMIEKVRLQLVVAGLHPRIQMPSDPYRFPIEGNDAVAYRVSERTGANDFGNTSNWAPIGLSAVGATNLMLASEKLGSRIALSNEADEDSFLPILSILEDKLALSMAEAQENVTINGCKSGTSVDTEASLYTNQSQLSAWDGYRRFLEVTSTAKISNGGTSSIDIAKIREVRQAMGKYGLTARDLVMVVGPAGYIKLLSTKDGANPSPVLTLEKYGPNATILTGEIGRIDGIPIIVSPMVGPYLNAAGNNTGAERLNASGIYDGVTTTFTEILFVRPSAFLYGDRRQASLKSREIIETDQQVMVVLQRLTFANLQSGNPVVGGLYNILR